MSDSGLPYTHSNHPEELGYASHWCSLSLSSICTFESQLRTECVKTGIPDKKCVESNVKKLFAGAGRDRWKSMERNLFLCYRSPPQSQSCLTPLHLTDSKYTRISSACSLSQVWSSACLFRWEAYSPMKFEMNVTNNKTSFAKLHKWAEILN